MPKLRKFLYDHGPELMLSGIFLFMEVLFVMALVRDLQLGHAHLWAWHAWVVMALCGLVPPMGVYYLFDYKYRWHKVPY